jgi:hypothetical protein
MVPEELRRKRSKSIVALAPAGTSWCAGCQSFRDLEDFSKGATACRACSSARSHAAMVAKTYGITSDDYATLLEAQEGRCAICGARPKSKRLAVDHDHKTGAVRGLLCSRCNHELMGAAWDSLAIASSLWHYMNTPPASGAWVTPAEQPLLMPDDGGAQRPPDASDDFDALVVTDAAKASERRSGPGKSTVSDDACGRPHYLPTGSQSIPGKRGAWRVWVEPDGDAPF